MAIIGWSELVVILSVLFLIALILIVHSFIKAMKRKVPSPKATTRICPHCERGVSKEAETKFCPYCGKKL
ncbi:MAG: hypothetical protein PVG48_01380 [Candidatus Bathyarchaeota archaeon]|jgi:rRNA maturation endonuclease Nob1